MIEHGAGPRGELEDICKLSEPKTVSEVRCVPYEERERMIHMARSGEFHKLDDTSHLSDARRLGI